MKVLHEVKYMKECLSVCPFSKRLLQLTSESMNIICFLNPSKADTEANHCSGIVSISVIALYIFCLYLAVLPKSRVAL